MKHLPIIAAALVIVSNIFVFAHVAYNRSGESKIITLTERELPLPFHYSHSQKDNSGLSLKIQTTAANPNANQYYWSDYHSLVVSKEKLQELSFTPPEKCDSGYKNIGGRDKSRQAWVALAYDGPTHTNYIATQEQLLEKRNQEIGSVNAKPEQEELKNLAKRLDEVKNYHSRLYIIDASLDKKSLQQLYTANAESIIFAAEIFNSSTCHKNEKEYKITVSKILPPAINVPIQFHDLLSALPERELHMPARYQAKIAIGKLNEPWLVEIEKTGN
jgi:Domain of unknown function (DUF4824)